MKNYNDVAEKKGKKTQLYKKKGRLWGCKAVKRRKGRLVKKKISTKISKV